MGMLVRDKLNDPVHQIIFGSDGSLARGKAASDNFRTNAGGQYYGVGVGGTPIGKGADIYIIDDPIRSRSDVESEKQREDLKAWYSSAVLSRLEGQGGIILMHQRWHEDDLAGYLLREHAEDGWRVISFPAIIEDVEDKAVDYLSRDYGEVLIPELHSKTKLLRLKQNMMKRDWLSMYQQRPTGSDGDMFTETMLQRYESDPVFVAQGMNVYIIVDPADSKSKHSDYTAMIVIGLGSDGNYYILDMIRERLNLKERTYNLLYLHRKWRPLITAYESYGAQSDIQHIEHIQETENYRFPITKLSDNKLKKEARIERLVPDMSNNRWYAPTDIIKKNSDGVEYSPLKALVEEEMLKFPGSKHDDAIDALSRIYDLKAVFPATGYSGKAKALNNRISPW